MAALVAARPQRETAEHAVPQPVGCEQVWRLDDGDDVAGAVGHVEVPVGREVVGRVRGDPVDSAEHPQRGVAPRRIGEPDRRQGFAVPDLRRDAGVGQHLARVDHLVDGGHAVVADDDQCQVVPHPPRVEPREQRTERGILTPHRRGDRRRVGTVAMPRRVGAVPP